MSESAGDDPVWHRSERDVFPGQAYAVPAMEPVETDAVASGGIGVLVAFP